MRNGIRAVQSSAMADDNRMKTIERNLKKLEILTQQHAAMLNLWRNSANLSFDEFQQKLEEQRLQWEDPQAQEHPNNGGDSEIKENSKIGEKLNINPGFNSVPRATNLGTNLLPENKTLEQESLEKPLTEIHQDAIIKNTSANQVIRKSHQQFEDDQPDSLQDKRSSAPAPSNLGIDLNFKLGLDDRRALSPSTEQQKSDFRRGISTFPQTEFLDFDGMQLSWVRSVNGFDGIIEWVDDSVETIELNLVDVKLGSTTLVRIFSAQKLFDKMPKRKIEVNSMNFNSTVVYLGIKIMVDGSCLIVVDNMVLVFDPGGVVDHGRSRFDSSYAAGLVHIWSELVWVFDPGDGLTSYDSCAAELRMCWIFVKLLDFVKSIGSYYPLLLAFAFAAELVDANMGSSGC